MRASSTTILANPIVATIVVASGLTFGVAFARPSIAPAQSQDAVAKPSVQAALALPDWVTDGKPGSGAVYLVRGRVGSGEDARAGYAWLAELERFHIAWGGAVAGGQDVVFMIEAPDHGKLDALFASGPWSQVAFTVEPLVRTKDKLGRGSDGTASEPKIGEPKHDQPREEAMPSAAPARPLSEPNHGDGTTHPAP